MLAATAHEFWSLLKGQGRETLSPGEWQGMLLATVNSGTVRIGDFRTYTSVTDVTVGGAAPHLRLDSQNTDTDTFSNTVWAGRADDRIGPGHRLRT